MGVTIPPGGVGQVGQIAATEGAQQTRLELVAAHVLAKLDQRVDEHFKAREAAGQPPYDQGKATITVIAPGDYASGNSPDLEEGLGQLEQGERAEVVRRVQQQLANAGYTSHVEDDLTNKGLRVTLEDKSWNPFPVYECAWFMQNFKVKHTYRYQPDPQGWIHQGFWRGGQTHTAHFNVVTKEFEVRRGIVTDRSAPQVQGRERDQVIRHAQSSVFNPSRLKPSS